MTRILVPYHLDEHWPVLDVPYEPAVTITRDLDGDDVLADWFSAGPEEDDLFDMLTAAYEGKTTTYASSTLGSEELSVWRVEVTATGDFTALVSGYGHAKVSVPGEDSDRGTPPWIS